MTLTVDPIQDDPKKQGLHSEAYDDALLDESLLTDTGPGVSVLVALPYLYRDVAFLFFE